MRLRENYPTHITLALSERNVKALYHKLTMENSARTIQRMCGGRLVTVTIEDDTVHYNDGDAPGRMHHETERFIAS